MHTRAANVDHHAAKLTRAQPASFGVARNEAARLESKDGLEGFALRRRRRNRRRVLKIEGGPAYA